MTHLSIDHYLFRISTTPPPTLISRTISSQLLRTTSHTRLSRRRFPTPIQHLERQLCRNWKVLRCNSWSLEAESSTSKCTPFVRWNFPFSSTPTEELRRIIRTLRKNLVPFRTITLQISSPYTLFPPPSLCGFNTKFDGFFNAISTASLPLSSWNSNAVR